jgi:hypothetical protein
LNSTKAVLFDYFLLPIYIGHVEIANQASYISIGDLTNELVLNSYGAPRLPYNKYMAYQSLNGGSVFSSLKSFVKDVAHGVKEAVPYIREAIPYVREGIRLGRQLSGSGQTIGGVMGVGGGMGMGRRISRASLGDY